LGERDSPYFVTAVVPDPRLSESEVVTTFHQARFTDRIVIFGYFSPCRGELDWYYPFVA
jgi:hypothetical protein